MNKLRTIPASAKEQILKFSIQQQIFAMKVVNKTTSSTAQLA